MQKQIPEEEAMEMQGLETEYQQFKQFWDSLSEATKNPAVIFSHFQRYFKPKWQASHPEQGTRWVNASERIPIDKAHWNKEPPNDFPVRMEGKYYMGELFDQSNIGEPEMLSIYFNSKHHFVNEFNKIEWLDESPSSHSEIPIDSHNAWPTQDVLKTLIWSAEYLLHKKSYDGPNYEEIETCVKRAKEIIQNLSHPEPKEGENISLSLNLKNLDKEVDNLLAKETPNSLHEWVKSQREVK